MIIPSQNLRSLRLCRCLNVGKYIISGPTSSTSQMVHGKVDDLPTKTASKRPSNCLKSAVSDRSQISYLQQLTDRSRQFVGLQVDGRNSMKFNGLESWISSTFRQAGVALHFWKSSIFDSAWIHEAPMCPKFVFCDGTIPSLLFKSAQPMQGYAGIKYKAWSSACIHVVFHPATASCRRHLWCISNFPLTRILTIGLQNVNGKQCWYCTQAIF